jgi:hypothetical protein
VFASIDAGLREIADRIARNQQENAADQALITVCEAELERTAVWDGAEKWQQLSAELATLTAELSRAEAAPAEQPTAGIVLVVPAEAQATEQSDIAREQAVAAALAAVDEHSDDPAWQIVAAPLDQLIPPATASLALLRTLGQTPLHEETSAPLDDHAPASVDALLETSAPVAAVGTSTATPTAPAKERPRFGDRALIERTRTRRKPKSSPPVLPVPDVPEQLELFGTLAIPTPIERSRELLPITLQQLTLL